MMVIMPWSKEHKQETRQRIVAAAAQAFRERGVAHVGVSEIMGSAGLTHGGFYAHFRSKDELVAEAMAQAFADARRMKAEHIDPMTDPVLGEAMPYLSPFHLRHPEHGCPLPTLASELARGAAKTRKALASGIRGYLKRFCERQAAGSEEARKKKAAGTLACMVGGMILARSLPEREATELLEDCRKFLADAIA